MKQGIGYTVDLNIIIIFIIIVFAFLSAVVVYFKSNKVNNVISNSIEKYEGYNSLAKEEIQRNLKSLGYSENKLDCGGNNDSNCKVGGADVINNDGINGYCVYYCTQKIGGEWYYYYKVKTRMMINIPLINSILDLPIFSNTSKMYDFEKNL